MFLPFSHSCCETILSEHPHPLYGKALWSASNRWHDEQLSDYFGKTSFCGLTSFWHPVSCCEYRVLFSVWVVLIAGLPSLDLAVGETPTQVSIRKGFWSSIKHLKYGNADMAGSDVWWWMVHRGNELYIPCLYPHLLSLCLQGCSVTRTHSALCRCLAIFNFKGCQSTTLFSRQIFSLVSTSS